MIQETIYDYLDEDREKKIKEGFDKWLKPEKEVADEGNN